VIKALGIIPARYLSTRFPGKALAQILGKSLVQRTFESAKKSSALQELIVATDDQRIFDHVAHFGGKAVMTSPECPTGTDRMAEALKKYSELREFEIIVNIQGDEPCLDADLISELVNVLAEDAQAVMSTPISHLKPSEADKPSSVKCVIDQQGYALYFSRALIPAGRSLKMQPQVAYYHHMGLYAFRREFLLKYAELKPTPLQMAEDLEQLKALEHGYKIRTILAKTQPLEVNVPEDIQKVEKYLCTQNSSS
jgi:3-deoxy-manno-octulosonate cytidylyltransferase (CMP-KDO synthetase)